MTKVALGHRLRAVSGDFATSPQEDPSRSGEAELRGVPEGVHLTRSLLRLSREAEALGFGNWRELELVTVPMLRLRLGRHATGRLTVLLCHHPHRGPWVEWLARTPDGSVVRVGAFPTPCGWVSSLNEFVARFVDGLDGGSSEVTVADLAHLLAAEYGVEHPWFGGISGLRRDERERIVASLNLAADEADAAAGLGSESDMIALTEANLRRHLTALQPALARDLEAAVIVWDALPVAAALARVGIRPEEFASDPRIYGLGTRTAVAILNARRQAPAPLRLIHRLEWPLPADVYLADTPDEDL